MIQIKQNLTKKEKSTLNSLVQDLTDIYKDFYITKQNLRLFIQENMDLLYEGLKKGDKIAFDEELGIIFIYGYSDKAPRKYLKILTKDEKSANRLLKVLSWHLKIDLYAKIKKANPIRKTLERNGFRYFADRGGEVLLYRQGNSTISPKIIKKEENK